MRHMAAAGGGLRPACASHLVGSENTEAAVVDSSFGDQLADQETGDLAAASGDKDGLGHVATPGCGSLSS